MQRVSLIPHPKRNTNQAFTTICQYQQKILNVLVLVGLPEKKKRKGKEIVFENTDNPQVEIRILGYTI